MVGGGGKKERETLVFTKATKDSQFPRDRTDEVSPPNAPNLLFGQFPGHSRERGGKQVALRKNKAARICRTKKEKAISRGTPEIFRGPLSSIQQSTNPCTRVNDYPGLGQKNPSEMLKETMSTTHKSRNSVYSHQTE